MLPRNVMRDYMWLRLMDSICWMRGHSVTSFPKGRFCLRCYKVEGADFHSVYPERFSVVRRFVKRLSYRLARMRRQRRVRG